MFDDAEKKIARLMAENTTSGESRSGLGTIKLKGQGNMLAMGDINLTVHITSNLPPTSIVEQLVAAAPALILETGPQREAILAKCREIGDPDLYRPFIKAAYGATRLEDLAAADLGRLEWWLGLRGDRPKP